MSLAVAEKPHLPAGWDTKTLGEISPAEYGKGLTAKTRRPGPVSVLASAGVVGEHDEALIDDGDIVVVGRKGAAGRVTLAQGPAWVIDTAYYIRVPDGINAKFLAFQLEASGLEALDQSTAIPSLSREDLHRVEVALPPLDEQERIVKTVEALMAQVAEGERQLQSAIDAADLYRTSVLAAAVSGTLVPNHFEDAPAGELLCNILRSREQRWVAARMGKPAPPALPLGTGTHLPDGWTWATVDQLAVGVQYGTSAKTNDDVGGVPVLRMGNIINGRLEMGGLKYLPASSNDFPALFLQDGDLLFNRTNSPELVGKTAVARELPEPCSFASYLIRARLAPEVLPEFVSYYLNSPFGRLWIKENVSQQVGQANVNGSKLRALTVPLPPLSVQRRIVERVEDLLGRSVDLERDLSRRQKDSVRLRLSVLHAAMTGKLGTVVEDA